MKGGVGDPIRQDGYVIWVVFIKAAEQFMHTSGVTGQWRSLEGIVTHGGFYVAATIENRGCGDNFQLKVISSASD